MPTTRSSANPQDRLQKNADVTIATRYKEVADFGLEPQETQFNLVSKQKSVPPSRTVWARVLQRQEWQLAGQYPSSTVARSYDILMTVGPTKSHQLVTSAGLTSSAVRESRSSTWSSCQPTGRIKSRSGSLQARSKAWRCSSQKTICALHVMDKLKRISNTP